MYPGPQLGVAQFKPHNPCRCCERTPPLNAAAASVRESASARDHSQLGRLVAVLLHLMVASCTAVARTIAGMSMFNPLLSASTTAHLRLLRSMAITIDALSQQRPLPPPSRGSPVFFSYDCACPSSSCLMGPSQRQPGGKRSPAFVSAAVADPRCGDVEAASRWTSPQKAGTQRDKRDA